MKPRALGESVHHGMRDNGEVKTQQRSLLLGTFLWRSGKVWASERKSLSHVRLCNPTGYTVHGIVQARILEWAAFPFSRQSSQPRSPALQADSLPAEPQGKPKNTGVGSLSLLQQIFLTQESDWGLLHCRWILYQLSYQGSPWVGGELLLMNILSVLLF